mgnify:CR=1 FL=1
MWELLLEKKKYFYYIAAIAVVYFAIIQMSKGQIHETKNLEYGITFSKKKVQEMNLDWKKAYVAILDDMKIKKIRLSAYWDEVEFNRDVYNWDDLDWQIEEANKRNVQIVLAVGGRLPRWPECHYPDWAKSLGKSSREQEILDYIEKVVSKYKDNKGIAYWQVENEPFLSHFGDCPKLDKKFLDKEIELVRKLDPRPIIITDSGELSLWIPAAKRADIFGTTMYRDTYSKHLERYVHYPIEPGFFHFKKNIAKLFAKPDDWIVIELQAEPWCRLPYQNVPKVEREYTMSKDKFLETIEFARLAGFRTFYLWGAEWWYWEKEANKDPEMWETAKALLSGTEQSNK